MDLSKIFLKDACPTKMGGQAVLNGIMMRGEDRTAVAVRLPDNRMHIKTRKLKKNAKWIKLPVIRGVAAFISSLVEGTKTLMYSAKVLEAYTDDEEEPDRLTKWFEKKFGADGAWNVMLYSSVIFAIIIAIGVFILLPTVLIHFLSYVTDSAVLLNLAEGILRIVMFVGYIILIALMPDIRNVFRYHGAEHKCIHCFENGLELTTKNCKKFYTLHPRCGTSFIMFVLAISLILFSLLGWPNLLFRITSRLLLVPLIAGLSYELLKWAGRSDSIAVKILSMPGLYLQKLTTKEPDESQLAVAIAAIKAVSVDGNTPCIEGICDTEGRIVEAGSMKTTKESGTIEKEETEDEHDS